MKTRRKIEYWGEGFPVELVDFPVYEDEGEYFPDVPLTTLGRAIGYSILKRATLLQGREVRLLRSLADLTRSQAARELGITRRTLINWEEEGDQPIKARPIMHLGLRTYFFAQIFADAAMPSEAMRLEAKVAEGPIEISFGEVEKRFGMGSLSFDGLPPHKSMDAGAASRPPSLVRSKPARGVSSESDAIKLERQVPMLRVA